MKGLTFDDVLLKPAYNHYLSRKDVDISMLDKLNKLQLKIPIFTSNMDTISESQMANWIGSKGGMAVLHRFMSIDDNVKQFKNCNFKTFVSVGVTEKELERIEALRDASANYFCVDIAHAHTRYTGTMIKKIREMLPNSCIMAGNVATHAGADFLASKGADIIKCGVGPGCFAAGTRVLMSNGYYKNIEDIKVGDRVINKSGKAVNVVKAWSTGYKSVIKYRHSHSHTETYATENHEHWVGDLNTLSLESIQARGYRDALSKETKKEESKFKWKELKNFHQDVLLFPSKLELEMEDTFKEDLKKYSIRDESINNFENLIITPSYSLGYIFGTFLGDGDSKVTEDNSGAVTWSFGEKENEIAEKVKTCIEEIFGIEAKIELQKSVLKVIIYSIVLSKFFKKFNQKQEKHLPEFYFINNIPYLQGMWDGIIDSDGHIEENGRVSFSNTSIKICELFNVISILLEKGHFQYGKPQFCFGKIKSKNLSYEGHMLLKPEYRNTDEFFISKILDYVPLKLEVRVYDIEVDCDTHSFIANGAIVHNSCCTTRIKTGFGVPQITAIQDCARVDRSIVADGGLRTPGDIVKALAFGADFVMLGGMLSGTHYTPGEIEWDKDGVGGLLLTGKKVFRGMASKEVADDYLGGLTEWKTSEGVATKVSYKNEKETEEILADIIGGLRSGMTYSGASNIKELQRKLDYMEVSQNGYLEGTPHIFYKR